MVTLPLKKEALAIVCGFTLACSGAAESPSAEKFYGFDRVLNVHLTFSPEDWQAIKPREPEETRGPGGPGAFGPGAMLAGVFKTQLDADKDEAFSREEFVSGFQRWFTSWDVKKTGNLDADAVRDGMNKDLNPFAAPAGAGAARPVGGPNFSLQARDGKRNGLSGMRGIDFEYVHADLELDGQAFRDVAVRYKGNGTYMDARNSDRKSFKLDLNEFVKGQKFRGQSKLNLHNNITDAARMNESLAYSLYREAGVPAPQTAYAQVSVTVPGSLDRKNFGLYSLVENPDTSWAKGRFDTKKGLILKPVTRELFIFKGTDWTAYDQAYDPKTDITQSQMKRVFAFAQLVTEANDEEFARRLPEFLDIDEFSRFMAVTVWLSSTDSILMMGQNFIVYLHPETNKFAFVPWDLDRAFGNFFSPSPEELSVQKAWGEDNRFLKRVMNVPEVRQVYLARLEEFQNSLFRPESLNERIDKLAALIRPVVTEESSESATGFDRAVANAEPSEAPAQAGPGGFRMPVAKPIKDFIKARHQSVASQLAGKSEGNPIGGGFGPPPGGGGNPPGAPGGRNFGPGNFLGPVFFKAADGDGDGQVSVAEFQALADRWFAEWGAATSGSLSMDQLRDGLAKAFPPPRFDAPPPGRP